MAVKEFEIRIRLKRDTGENWSINNPILLNGEMILVDTPDGDVRAKTGDGIHSYNQLPFNDENIYALLNDSKAHIENSISSESGVHGLRYYNNRLQYIEDGDWKTINIGELLI